MAAPLPHELLVSHQTSFDDHLADTRPPPGSNRRTNPLAAGMERAADNVVDMVDRLRAKPLVGRSRGRSGSGGRSNSRSRGRSGERRRSGSSDDGNGRSRSRSFDSWDRSLSPPRSAGRRDRRKGKLFSNYARYTGAHGAGARGTSDQGPEQGHRELDDALRLTPGRGARLSSRPRRWRGLRVFQVTADKGPPGEAFDVETGQSKDRDEGEVHPFVLPPNVRLAPRIDVWFAFAVASCAAVASIGQIHVSSGREGLSFGPGDKFALAVCAMSFIASLLVAGAMRYAPARTSLTAPRFTTGPAPLRLLGVTRELLLLSLLLLLWTAALPVITNGRAYYSESRAGVALGMAGTSIWNANLFYASWGSYLLCVYLFVEVVTLNDRRGTLRVDSASSRPTNAFPKRWTLLSFAAMVLLSASIVTYTGPACTGSFLKQTTYCSRALWGLLVGGFLQALVTMGVAALYRLSAMGTTGTAGSRSRRNRGAVLSTARRNRGCALAAFASLILQSVNAGMLTSPNGGGPGTTSGTLYFASWLGFGVAFELCLRYLELWSVDVSSGARSRGLRSEVDKATVYEEESEEEEGVLMLRNGSEGGSRRSHASPLEVFERSHASASDGMDAQSFVFDEAGEGPVREVRRLSPDEQRKHDAQERAYVAQARRGTGPREEQRKPSPSEPQRPTLEPEELRLSDRTSSGGGTDPLAGSIDVRSAKRSSSGSSPKASPKASPGARRALRDEAAALPPPPSYRTTSYRIDRAEELDDVPAPIPAMEPEGGSMPRMPSGYATAERHPSNLSPLQEGSGESASPAESSPKPQNGKEGRRVGDNLRNVRAARPSRPRPADRPKSRSRSKERGAGPGLGLGALPTAAAAAGRGSSRRTSSTKGSGSRAPSKKSGKSRKSRKSASTASSRRGAEPTILTDDEGSGSNPPPTVSDAGRSRKGSDGASSSAPSTVDAPSTQSGSGNPVMGTIRPGRPAAAAGPPPPPPFARPKPPSGHKPQDEEADDQSQYSSSAPLRSIRTTRNSQGGSSDSIVSDPTLDAGLDDPSPKAKPKARSSSSGGRSGSSGRAASRSRSRGKGDHPAASTGSYEKKYSDETERVPSSGSDENPSSQDADASGGNVVVDNIVAAALAYAEKTHAGSGTASGSRTRGGSHSGPRSQVKPTAATTVLPRRSTTGDSIHSFYTDDTPGDADDAPAATSRARPRGDPRRPTSAAAAAAAPVDDLVARALSHAQGQLSATQQRSASDGQQRLNHSQEAWEAQRPRVPRSRSEYSAGKWTDGKSVGSMYSVETDEFSGRDVGMHFDC